MGEEDEVALGVAQLAAFQVVLIFTAVAAILALTCRLRVFSSHEPARLKVIQQMYTSYEINEWHVVFFCVCVHSIASWLKPTGTMEWL